MIIRYFFASERKIMKKKVLSLSLILVILLFLCPDIRARADTGIAFYITHKHTGSRDACGGCYTLPHYHVHSDPGSGDCYTPRYHEHTGSPSGGGCYTVPVLHEHTGDGTCAEGCYVARYHSHNSDCYRTGSCNWQRTIRTVGLTESWCHIHRDITQVEAEITETHSSCGQDTRYDYVSYCPSCGYSGAMGGVHDYSVLTCTKGTSYVEGYVLGCSHVEGDVDHYDPGCDMEGVIEGYDLTCSKTGSHIDFYDPGCGLEDGQNAVAVRVDQSPVSGGGMQLTVSLEDQSGGVIDISGADFLWKDTEGNELGTGDSLTVSANGTYGLSVIVSDDGIYADSCNGNVEVTGIRPPSSGGGNGNDNPGDNRDEGDGSSNGDGSSGNGYDSGSDSGDDDTYYAVATPTPTPTATPAVAVNTGSNGKTDTRETSSGSKWRNDDADSGSDGSSSDDMFIGKADQTAGIDRNITVEKRKADATKTEAGNKENLDKGEVSDTDPDRSGGFLGKAGQFLRTPAGRVITIGVSTALLIGAGFLLLVLLRRTVIVFNFDGQMKRHFVGIVFIRLKKDGYELEIPDDICERAYTSRYEFFMGFFMIGCDSDTQILVIKKDRQTMAKIERMMRVTI